MKSVIDSGLPDEDKSVKPAAPKKMKNTRQVGMWMTVTIAVVAVVVGFIGGTRSEGIFVWLSSSQNKDLATDLDFSSVQQVYDKLRGQFDGKLDAQKLVDGAKKGLVEAAGDPYTVYFTDAEAKSFLDTLDGKFSGIGAELDKRDSSLVVVNTLDDSPARKAGVLAKDIIVKVNGQDSSSWSIDKAVSEIRGPKGTTVKLTLVRNQQLKEISIVRDNIINPSVTYTITDNIGYLRIARFADTDTSELAKKAADEFKAKGVKGVVLDLRGDGGGYLTAAQDVASLWLPEGKVVVQEKRGDTTTDTLYAKGESAPLEGIPTVVLIDGGSASASEILSGALHDHKAAQLVGLKSFGKGSVQNILKIDSGGQIKVTIAKWYTPGGINISKQGIEPDIKVDITPADIAAGHDVQKDKAFELLKK